MRVVHQKIIDTVFSCSTLDHCKTCISFINNEPDAFKKRYIANLIEIKILELRLNAINKCAQRLSAILWP